VAALGSPVRRAVAPRYSSKTTGPLKRRLVVGGLILASLAMITVYFRESPNGGLHGFQSTGASVLRPFEIGADRIARPFEDAYRWTADLFHARAENKDLRKQLSIAREQAIRNATARDELDNLRHILKYKRGPSYPEDFPNSVTAAVLSNPASQFDQTVVIAAGRTSGIRVYDAVVTGLGLVGQVTKVTRDEAKVTLLSDQKSAVTAKDRSSGAIGIVRHSQGSEDVLFLDRVAKSQQVKEGDLVMTAGLQQGELPSFYPKGIPIGLVTKVGQNELDEFQVVQVMPLVDFSSVETVVVLISDKPRPQMP
jgi:rod shape-determining protein MreC